MIQIQLFFFKIHQKWFKIQYFLLQENFTVKNLTILIFKFKNDKNVDTKNQVKKKKEGENRKMSKIRT